jgi:hypothetical protein
MYSPGIGMFLSLNVNESIGSLLKMWSIMPALGQDVKVQELQDEHGTPCEVGPCHGRAATARRLEFAYRGWRA